VTAEADEEVHREEKRMRRQLLPQLLSEVALAASDRAVYGDYGGEIICPLDNTVCNFLEVDMAIIMP